MMMQALEAGGLRVGRAPKGDPLRDYYELPRDVRAGVWQAGPLGYGLRDWLEPYRGQAVKLLTGTVQYVPEQPHGIVCVFMRRAAEEIQASAEREFASRYRLDAIERAVEQEISRWRARPDVRFLDLWYDKVLEDPEGAFEKLRAHGFPINPRKAARVVNAAQRHFQREAA